MDNQIKKKILVIEDDKYLWNAYNEKLTGSGFEVKLASDGEEALKMIAEFQPTLILLDIVIPKKDGFAVLEEIKKNTVWQNIPVIVTSNLSQQEDVSRSMQLGARDFIVKSDTSINELVEKINLAISDTN